MSISLSTVHNIMIILREYGKFSVQKGQVQKSVLDIHHPETLGA